ncbi:MAG: hypothetical protein AAF633_16595 [Chloroflexota bacterium]
MADPAHIDQIYADANPAKKTLLHRRCAEFFTQRSIHQEAPISQLNSTHAPNRDH